VLGIDEKVKDKVEPPLTVKVAIGSNEPPTGAKEPTNAFSIPPITQVRFH
jgi:hypothetical protein